MKVHKRGKGTLCRVRAECSRSILQYSHINPQEMGEMDLSHFDARISQAEGQ